jgi:hypothetical protein
MGFESNSGCRQNAQGDEGKSLGRKEMKGKLRQSCALRREEYSGSNSLAEEPYHKKSSEGDFLHSFRK